MMHPDDSPQVLSRYVVMNYVPSPAADERINLGLIALDLKDDAQPATQFTSSWERVYSFGPLHYDLVRQRVTEFPDLLNELQTHADTRGTDVLTHLHTALTDHPVLRTSCIHD